MIAYGRNITSTQGNVVCNTTDNGDVTIQSKNTSFKSVKNNSYWQTIKMEEMPFLLLIISNKIQRIFYKLSAVILL